MTTTKGGSPVAGSLNTYECDNCGYRMRAVTQPESCPDCGHQMVNLSRSRE